MSAYVVNTDLVDLIVTAADTLGRRRGGSGFFVRWDEGQAEWLTRDSLTDLGGLLLAENVRSVNYRYGETMPTDPAVLGYQYRPVHDLGVSIAATWWDVLSGISCLRYQSCEHPEWGESLAARVLDRVERLVVDHLTPDTAAWEWTREEGKRRMAEAREKVRATMEIGR